jgi:hypothetical protein
MELYDGDISVREGINQFFERFGIPPDAYTMKHFTLPLGPFRIRVPNIPGRVVVARFHDIHHVLTGYPANWKGEAEIGAWEIATGCRSYFIAWFLNGGALLIGLMRWPRAVWRAWLRGRRTRTNLYHDFDYDTVLSMKIKDLRASIDLAEV